MCRSARRRAGVPLRIGAVWMVVLEGMLEGMVIAPSDVGGPAEILEHERTALLSAPRDVAALAEAVPRLVRDPLLRHRLGTAAADDVRCRWLWPSADARFEPPYGRAASAAVGFRGAA